jgi:hypothetical protein
MKNLLAAVFLLSFAVPFSPLAAQDFGFGFDEESDMDISSADGGALGVSIGGEVSASMMSFFDNFGDGADTVRLGNIFSGRLNFTMESSNAEGVINLKIAPTPVYYEGKSPMYVDEAYVRAYFGNFDVEGGLRKLTWGKVDSMGPLDVINPADMSDLSGMSDSLSLKIARPLVHVSLRFGQFSKVEGVFVPNFEPGRFAASGRWAALPQMAALSSLKQPDATTLDYAQAGLRYTTSIGGAADIGAQYYYGRLATLAVTITSMSPLTGSIAYNPYHQIGVDYAQVLLDFNIRAEFAANITEDIDGDNDTVYNPSLAWSLGFDRDLFWGINLNAQCNETIRLLDSEISSPGDIEADSDLTSTRITAALTKKFLKYRFLKKRTKKFVYWTCSITRLVIEQVLQNASHFAVF